MANRQPNILLLFADQEAFYRHGAARPNLAQLARRGVRFDRAYSVCPLCTPARRSLVTSLYPHAHGYVTLDPAQNLPGHDRGLLYGLLAGRGYECYAYGKWHTGPGTAHDHGCKGFSYPGFGNPYITPEYAAYCAARGLEPARFTVEHVFMEPVSPDRPAPGPGYRCEARALHPHVTGVLETPAETHESAFLAELACARLRKLAARREHVPFFMRVDMWGPHAPYLASREYVDMYPPGEIVEYGSYGDTLEHKPDVYRKEWNEPLARDNRLLVPSALSWPEWQRVLRYVYAQVTQVDAACGMVLDTLDELGMAEDTLVVWTADHGDAVASFGGHLGKEAPLTEEVLRIPMAVRWPGRIPEGQVSEQLVSTVDVPATLLAAAGGAFRAPVHGRSLLEALGDDGAHEGGVWRDAVLAQTYGHHWEPVVGRALITERYRYAVYQYHDVPDYLPDVRTGCAQEELYDLLDDPYQLHNLVERDGHAGLVGEMRRRLGEAQDRVGDPLAFTFV